MKLELGFSPLSRVLAVRAYLLALTAVSLLLVFDPLLGTLHALATVTGVVHALLHVGHLLVALVGTRAQSLRQRLVGVAAEKTEEDFLGLGAVGIVDNHATAETGARGLLCDQL